MLHFNALVKWPVILTLSTFFGTGFVIGVIILFAEDYYQPVGANTPIFIICGVTVVSLNLYYLGWGLFYVLAPDSRHLNQRDPLEWQRKSEYLRMVAAIEEYAQRHHHLDDPMEHFERDIPQLDQLESLRTTLPAYQRLREEVIKRRNRREFRRWRDILKNLTMCTLAGSVIGVLIMFRDWDEIDHHQHLYVDLIIGSISGMITMFLMYWLMWCLNYIFASGTDIQRDLKRLKIIEIRQHRMIRKAVEAFNRNDAIEYGDADT